LAWLEGRGIFRGGRLARGDGPPRQRLLENVEALLEYQPGAVS
jgi:hypothetical protein